MQRAGNDRNFVFYNLMGKPECYRSKGSIKRRLSKFRLTPSFMSIEEIAQRQPFCVREHSNRKRTCIINAENVNYSSGSEFMPNCDTW